MFALVKTLKVWLQCFSGYRSMNLKTKGQMLWSALPPPIVVMWRCKYTKISRPCQTANRIFKKDIRLMWHAGWQIQYKPSAVVCGHIYLVKNLRNYLMIWPTFYRYWKAILPRTLWKLWIICDKSLTNHRNKALRFLKVFRTVMSKSEEIILISFYRCSRSFFKSVPAIIFMIMYIFNHVNFV